MVTTKGAAKAPHGSGNARNASAPPSAPAAKADGAPGRLLRVTHDTEYRYAARVESAQHQARLQPLVTPRQQVLSFALDIDPAPESVGTEIDAFGNARASFALNQPHDALLVRSRSTVRVTPPVWSRGARGEPPPAIAKPDAKQAMAWEAVRDRLRFRAGSLTTRRANSCSRRRMSCAIPNSPRMRPRASRRNGRSCRLRGS